MGRLEKNAQTDDEGFPAEGAGHDTSGRRRYPHVCRLQENDDRQFYYLIMDYTSEAKCSTT
jgi:hypothetical protein